jgi:hypothetical protein
VSSWWKLTVGYNDASARDDAVVPFSSPLLAGQRSVAYTLGKRLKTPDIGALVVESLAISSSTSAFPADSNAIYFVALHLQGTFEDYKMHIRSRLQSNRSRKINFPHLLRDTPKAPHTLYRAAQRPWPWTQFLLDLRRW